jgi:acetylornithine/N-succinyldiaminopimelate aminotransferase
MSAHTKGQQIYASEKIAKLVKELSHEVYEYNKQINAIKPADTGLVDTNRAMMERVSQSRGRPLYHPYIGTSAGNGAYVELEDGSVKLDLINGIGIHIMGHGHPKLIEAAIKGALSDIVMQGNLEPNKEYLQMTEKLVALAGRKSRLKYAWLSTCGTMANENALKMARQKNSPARKILAFKDAFAGRSTLMAEITDNPAYKVGLPEYNEVLRLPFYDKKIDGPISPAVSDKYLALLKEHYAKHEKNISCFVFEPMQGEGGYKAGSREFFAPMFEFCREKKIAVWADEVQTFTRTGEFFAFETLGLGEYIDLCTIAKTAQVGATLYTEEYNPKPGLIAGTFSGSSVALAVGLEILRILEQDNYVGPNGRIQEIHKKFVGMLNELNETTCAGKLSDAGGLGLMIAVTPYDGNKDRPEALIKRLFQNGLIAFGCGKDPYRMRFLVPAVIKDGDIQVVKKILEKSILEET